jgi:pimeloyl-ACP methyl ester carboxylesterase
MPRRHPVLLLPGGVLPGALAYPALVDALGERVDARVKELEVYAGDAPPSGFGLHTEVDGITRAADEAQFERFHLVGYSGGGASSIAFTAAHPDRLLSLTLLEPAWAGNERLPREEALFQRFRELPTEPTEAFMNGFTRLQLREDVEPPPRPGGPPPPWMAKRPAGLRAFLAAFDAADLDLDALRRFDRPVLYVLGGLSHPDYYATMVERLAGIFPDFRVEVFPDRHHFDPPHRAEPERLAPLLLEHWNRATA